MDKTLLIALAVALVTPFAALADPATFGVPDITCQTPADWRLHDYGAPTAGRTLTGLRNGNLQECGTTYGHFVGPNDCETIRPFVPPFFYPFLCETDRPADWDGDAEFAYGGAVLASASGPVLSPSGQQGAGSLECLGSVGHHPQSGNVLVSDMTGTPAAFEVAADWSQPQVAALLRATGQPDCGDGLVQPCSPPPQPSALPFPADAAVDSVNLLVYRLLNEPGVTCNRDDFATPCVDSCPALFSPGANGAYLVLVGLTLAGNAGEPTVATGGHVYL